MAKSELRQQLNLSPAVEDYLKAIYHLREVAVAGGAEMPRVTTSALAERLDVAPASVTGMLKKLADLALVTHTPYHGVTLTATGEQLALELIRHHRLLELYLVAHVGFSWDEVHEQADALEHAISEELEDRIAELLGDPTSDPHGDPIPTKAGQVPALDVQPLADVEPSATTCFMIRRVLTQDVERLRYLTNLRLIPGTLVTIIARDPFAGPLWVRRWEADGPAEKCALSPDLARLVLVAPTPDPAQIAS